MKRFDFEGWYALQSGDGCFEPPLPIAPPGYPRVTLQGVRMRGHRASWLLHHGDVPEGLFVCHTCDNRKCVRIEHLFLGTAKDNTQDCISKGRFYREKETLFCEDTLAEMFYGNATFREIGEVLGVDTVTAFNFTKRRGMTRNKTATERR